MFSLGVQRQLAQSVVAWCNMSVPPAGTRATTGHINTLPLGDLADRQLVANGANRQPVSSVPGLRLHNPGRELPLTAATTALQAGIRMENRHGLTLQLAYTFSHQMD